MSKRISVITPSFNSAAFIEDTILSVLAELVDGDEYIICDGGSSDGTREIILKYEASITHWWSEQDLGQSDAINKGMRAATGDILCWLNADDVFMPGALSHVRNLFSVTDCEWLTGGICYMDASGALIGQKLPDCFEGGRLFRRTESSRQLNPLQASTFWSADLRNQVGELNTSYDYCMDRDFWCRAYLHGYVPFLSPHFFSAFRLHDKSKTTSHARDFRREASLIHLKVSFHPNGMFFANLNLSRRAYSEYCEYVVADRGMTRSHRFMCLLASIFLTPARYVRKPYLIKEYLQLLRARRKMQ